MRSLRAVMTFMLLPALLPSTAQALCQSVDDATVCWTSSETANGWARDCSSVDAVGQHADRCADSPSVYTVTDGALRWAGLVGRKVGDIASQFGQCTWEDVCEHVPGLP